MLDISSKNDASHNAPLKRANARMKKQRRRYINSSSFVMAALFTVLCGIAALSLGYFINFFATGHFVDSTEATLNAEIRYVEAVGASEVTSQNGDRLYVFLDEDGQLPNRFSKDFSRLAEGILVFDYPLNNKRYAAKIHTFSDNSKMLIGTDITSISKDFQFMQWLGIASICFVMLVVFVAYIISVFVVSETNKIADTAYGIIKTSDLSRRLDVGSRWDDLGNMAAVLNMMLDRIEQLMQGVKQVSDNIAHDLRTPLTRMRGHIEDLSDGSKKDELLGEADHLLDTFNALLRISRIEAEKQRSHFQDVNLKDLLEDVIDFYEPLMDEKSITLATDLNNTNLRGDRDLLFQAYANLLDNAVKYTPKGGDISVSLKQENDKIFIYVSDTGGGVDEGEQNKIFQRFYRSEACRSSQGTGLGLTLVTAVIDLHEGSIVAENTLLNDNAGLSIITIF